MINAGPGSRLSHAIGAADLDETQRLAQWLADALTEGDIVLLVGDLGSGKTTFTKHLAAALGVDEPVTSPTFTIVRHYETRTFPLLHVDAYRLERPEAWGSLGLDELIDDGAVAVIEWGDLIEAAVATEYLTITFRWVDDEHRDIGLDARGPSWTARIEKLVA